MTKRTYYLALAATLFVLWIIACSIVLYIMWPALMTQRGSLPPRRINASLAMSYADIQCKPDQRIIQGQCWDIVRQRVNYAADTIHVERVLHDRWVYPHGGSCPIGYRLTSAVPKADVVDRMRYVYCVPRPTSKVKEQ